MRLLRLDHVKAGMIMMSNFEKSHHNIMIKEGTTLTDSMINAMHRWGVNWIYVSGEIETRTASIPEWTKVETFEALNDEFENIIECMKYHRDLPAKHLDQLLCRLIVELSAHKAQLFQLREIRCIERDDFLHAYHVCVLSLMIGFRMELPFEQLRALAIGAFLHDIGKFDVHHLDCSSKPELHHTFIGYKKLKGEPLFPLQSSHAALMHHEHVDGSGKPRGITSNEMHQIGKIVGIANRYDHYFRALAPFSENDPPLQHHDVYERMVAQVGVQSDHDIFLHFLSSVVVYPTGVEVLLNTHQHAIVIVQHPHLPSRPIIRIIDSEQTLHDLSKNPKLFIIDVLT